MAHQCSLKPRLYVHVTALFQIRQIPDVMRRTLIAPRIMMQILLMIIFRIPPSPRLNNLRRNLPLPPLLIDLPRNLLRNLLLLS